MILIINLISQHIVKTGVGQYDQEGAHFPQPVSDTDSLAACVIFNSSVNPGVKSTILIESAAKMDMNSSADIIVQSKITPNYKMQLQNTVPVVQVRIQVHDLFFVIRN